MTPQDIKVNYVADLYGEMYLSEQEGAAPPLKRRARVLPGHYGRPLVSRSHMVFRTLCHAGYSCRTVDRSCPELRLGRIVRSIPALILAATSGLRWGIVLLGTQVTAMQIGSWAIVAFLGLIGMMTDRDRRRLLGARIGWA